MSTVNTEPRTLGGLARYIRSKNAGPFWVTVDIFFDDDTAYDAVAASGVINPDMIAALYGVRPEQVKIFFIADLRAIKVSYPRTTPQGSVGDRDMHAAQQFIPLRTIEVPLP
ncbi:DUF4387 domain-containing protein [Streptomyces sp. NPDC059255]|uniref:DUF4387 domain-containing protein n=1 Tax=Streptomyces sp. NPDC059255 TaxID=3346793 RepID=UPI003698FD30